MNYTCIVQQSIQSDFWNRKRQVTLHPVVIYYTDENGVLCHQSICFVSDDLDHDVGHVYLTQKHVTDYIKTHFPHVTEIEYFTDGCSKQYKNCKAFLNLCRHEELFGLKATWSFFATSHGKSPCDGIGGTVKRAAARASLRRIANNLILDAKSFFKFCNEEINDSKLYFEFLSQAAADAARLEMKLFGVTASTVPGTLSFHYFEPIAGMRVNC